MKPDTLIVELDSYAFTYYRVSGGVIVTRESSAGPVVDAAANVWEPGNVPSREILTRWARGWVARGVSDEMERAHARARKATDPRGRGRRVR